MNAVEFVARTFSFQTEDGRYVFRPWPSTLGVKVNRRIFTVGFGQQAHAYWKEVSFNVQR